MNKINIALLSGGFGGEREVSINSGDNVFNALNKDKYNIFKVKRDGGYGVSSNVSSMNGIEIKVIDLSGLEIKDNTIRLVVTNSKTQWDIEIGRAHV